MIILMTQVSTNLKTDSESEESPREVVNTSRNRLTLDIAGAAIFGALSILVSALTTQILPRVEGWGIAFFDPVSIIWITAFLIFGWRCGLMTFTIGTIGLIPFDTYFWIGPFMKFFATIWFIIVPYYFTKIRLRGSPKGSDMKKLSNYIPSMVLAWLIRLPVMFIMNIIVVKL